MTPRSLFRCPVLDPRPKTLNPKEAKVSMVSKGLGSVRFGALAVSRLGPAARCNLQLGGVG